MWLHIYTHKYLNKIFCNDINVCFAVIYDFVIFLFVLSILFYCFFFYFDQFLSICNTNGNTAQLEMIFYFRWFCFYFFIFIQWTKLNSLKLVHCIYEYTMELFFFYFFFSFLISCSTFFGMWIARLEAKTFRCRVKFFFIVRFKQLLYMRLQR